MNYLCIPSDMEVTTFYSLIPHCMLYEFVLHLDYCIMISLHTKINLCT